MFSNPDSGPEFWPKKIQTQESGLIITATLHDGTDREKMTKIGDPLPGWVPRRGRGLGGRPESCVKIPEQTSQLPEASFSSDKVAKCHPEQTEQHARGKKEENVAGREAASHFTQGPRVPGGTCAQVACGREM